MNKKTENKHTIEIESALQYASQELDEMYADFEQSGHSYVDVEMYENALNKLLDICYIAKILNRQNNAKEREAE